MIPLRGDAGGVSTTQSPPPPAENGDDDVFSSHPVPAREKTEEEDDDLLMFANELNVMSDCVRLCEEGVLVLDRGRRVAVVVVADGEKTGGSSGIFPSDPLGLWLTRGLWGVDGVHSSRTRLSLEPGDALRRVLLGDRGGTTTTSSSSDIPASGRR
jgi:hypothetical protein